MRGVELAVALLGAYQRVPAFSHREALERESRGGRCHWQGTMRAQRLALLRFTCDDA